MGRTPPPEMPAPVEGQPAPKLTLEECFLLALRRNENVAISREEIAKANASFFLAASESLGDVSFVMNHTFQEHQRGSGESGVGGSLTRSESRSSAFTISQPIFRGFRSLGAITGAGSLKNQRQNETHRTVELLFLDIIDAFYNLLAQKRDVRTIREIHKLFHDRIGDLNEREKIGRSRISEVASARARMRTLEAELAQSRGGLSIARYILEFLTGEDLAPQNLNDRALPEDEEESLDVILESAAERVDVQAAKEAMRVAKKAITVAQSGLWPQINYESNHYQNREGFQKDIDWDMLIKVEIPLFRGGENIGLIKEAVSEYKQAKLVYERTYREAILEIKQSYENWQTSKRRSKALQQAVADAEENFKFQQEEYGRNLVSNLDVLEALQILLETRQDANQAYYEMKGNFWRLVVARGNLPVEMAAQEVKI